MTVTEFLLAPRRKIRYKRHWTQEAYARDRHGYPTDLGNAKSYCLVGALDAVRLERRPANWSVYEEARSVLARAAREAGFSGQLISFNDNPTREHRQVKRVLNRAIELSRETPTKENTK